MDPVVYLVVLAVTAIAAYVFGRATASPSDDASLTSSSSDAPRAASSSKSTGGDDAALQALRTKLSDAEKDAKASERDLKKLREELKDAKQKSHDRGQRLDQARKELEDERRKLKSLGSIESTRQEMIAAREEIARLEAQLASSERSAEPRVEVAKEAAPEPTAAGETSETIRRYESILDARDAEFRKELRAQADELRASFNAQVSDERTRAKDELRSLQGRLRTALRDADRERRRSEANDRAYLILKSQLEGTLDRLAAHDPTLRRPDALDRPQG